ncbi:unnamed protein product [Bemisia tabaci]|uniref:Uncharacterized protein n=1 Tax=Bemisia tabaci TaxID=7038 RepID=A0A9P0AK47_BEMTA|nr:unnamed protein product [Bemisia tabaci]
MKERGEGEHASFNLDEQEREMSDMRWNLIDGIKNYNHGRKGGRLYPAYSLSGSEGEDNSPSRYLGSGRVQHTYQQPGALSDTQTSDNASDATLTDSELALARDSTLLVHNETPKLEKETRTLDTS